MSSNALALLDAVGLKLADLEKAAGDLEMLAPKEPRFKDVQAGPEFLRILALPRRPSPRVDSPDAIATAKFLTETLSRVARPFPGPLRSLQGASLAEAWQCKGLAGFIRVGGGKMLMSYLLPAVLRLGGLALLVSDAQMRADTAAMFVKYQFDWRGPPLQDIPFRSYQELANPSNGEDLDESGNVIRLSLLERLRPRIIILDEAHLASSNDNVARRRIADYRRKYPDTVMIILTGTPFNTSIKDAAHLLEWALGDQSPLPRTGNKFYTELEAWSCYLDVRETQGPKTGVGALLQFLTPDDLKAYWAAEDAWDKRKVVRRAIARWMYDTPGVISSQEGKLIDDDGREIGLEIMATETITQSDEVEEYFKILRGDALDALREGRKREYLDEVDENTGLPLLAFPGWRLPDGTEGEDGLWFAAAADKGGLGFWQRPPPKYAPPEEYALARNDWARWCRKMIKLNRRGIDSAARMMQCVDKGLYDDEGRLAKWREAQATYTRDTGLKEPPTEPVWLSDEAIRSAQEWVRKHNGLIWVRYTGLGDRLAEDLGIPFYRKGCKDAKTKRHIMQHPGGAAVVAVQSAKVGKNLQGLWSKNLWMCPPGEQTLARTHRAGQKADVVQNWVYIGCHEHLKSYYRGRDDKADFQGDMTLQAQKLEYADGEMPTLEALQARGTNRWTSMTFDDHDDPPSCRITFT